MSNAPNCITEIAEAHGRDYIIPEDVIEAFVTHRRDHDDDVIFKALVSTALPVDIMVLRAYIFMAGFRTYYL